MDEELETEVQEVGTPTLASMLEAPEQEESKEETKQEEVEQKLEEGEKKEEALEQKIEDAEEDGAAASEIQELRGLLREMRQANLQLKLRLEKVEGVQKGEMGKDPEPGVLETLQGNLNEIAERRGESFSTLLEAMELNPKYEDVREVCSRGNFNDIFEAVATHQAEENGTSFDEELLKAKIDVWKMPNPYKYMYETIKEYHPSYKGKAEAKAAEKQPAPKTAKEVLASANKGREPKPVVAPGSVAGLGGSATEQGGWTAAKIDALPESELKTVPKAIYTKWLHGELD